MALSDCEKCWDTPCTCGHYWRNYSEEAKRKQCEAIMGEKMYSKEEVENMLFGITAILYKLMYDKDFRKKYAPDDLVVSSTLCWDNKDEDELIKDCLNKIREIKENL